MSSDAIDPTTVANVMISPPPEGEDSNMSEGNGEVQPTLTLDTHARRRQHRDRSSPHTANSKKREKKMKLAVMKPPKIPKKVKKEDEDIDRDDMERGWVSVDVPMDQEGPGDDDDFQSIDNEDMMPLRISDRESVTRFLECRFILIQQLSCKTVAKCWIKVVEPKKQSHSPYNGGNATRPWWWPQNVLHKEPDHLLKDGRIEVLIAVVRSGICPIAKLKAATDESPSLSDRVKELLAEVYKIADLEQQFKKGCLDQHHIAYVRALSVRYRARRNSREKKTQVRKERRQSQTSTKEHLKETENSVDEQPKNDIIMSTPPDIILKAESNEPEVSPTSINLIQEISSHGQLQSQQDKVASARRQSTPGITAGHGSQHSPAILQRSNSLSVQPSARIFSDFTTDIPEESMSGQGYFNSPANRNLNLNCEMTASQGQAPWFPSPANSIASPLSLVSIQSPEPIASTPISPSHIGVPAPAGFSFEQCTVPMGFNSFATQPLTMTSYGADFYSSYALQELSAGFPHSLSLEEQISSTGQHGEFQSQY
ncbi:hypothetical protein ABW19_dt0209685 [Dactylella cylindrospora]|nr:hypothetical protein ABW19_dt0209685 [Dactylella cylindrospora]